MWQELKVVYINSETRQKPEAVNADDLKTRY